MTGSGAGDPRIDGLLAAVAGLRATVRAHDERHTHAERKLGELDGYSQEQAEILTELVPQVRALEDAEPPGDPSPTPRSVSEVFSARSSGL
ncbi:hypothetical protein FVA95_27655 [Pseudonocardia sp. EV170527-09]|uniref:hypothetical protein n=1 Tax=Pseudonocardia sp. EV170527-09 TaxID=2603411 RepID=UPI0011F0A702|nr:hypothetical protein [Pseudonocardia sp. EV170527-09]KAA1011838.1 hypothetical protein FVA95_27655 [Pseudonocardia sp. EV170527-09]